MIIVNSDIRLKVPAGRKRSKKWRKVRQAHLKKYPQCVVCGSRDKKRNQVHHIIPFHIKPELELDESNLITLCESSRKNCHFQFGHLYSWRSYNTDVVKDTKIWHIKIQNRP